MAQVNVKGEWVFCGLVAVWLLLQQSQRSLVAAVVVSAAGATGSHIVFFWTAFVSCVVGAVVTLLCGFVVMLPLQYFSAEPEAGVVSTPRNRVRMVASAFVVSCIVWALLEPSSTLAIILGMPLVFALALLFSAAGIKLRKLIADIVIKNMVLPASSLTQSDVMISGGRRVPAQHVIEQLRRQYLAPDPEAARGTAGTWVNVAVQSPAGTLDAAYFENPNQAVAEPADRKWMIWFLGNGEVYEFMFKELQKISADTGISVFAFNFRGVARSGGTLVQASDLVDDGKACFDHVCSSLGARPENVMLYGHSIGGAVAVLVAASCSPTSPVVNERSFSTLGLAARSILTNVLRQLLGFRLKIPVWLVNGLLGSVFPGRLDVAAAWPKLKGPKLIVYSESDAIIPYRSCSLHNAVKDSVIKEECIKLTDLSSGDNHNSSITSFPEYMQVLQRCQMMVGIANPVMLMESLESFMP